MISGKFDATRYIGEDPDKGQVLVRTVVHRRGAHFVVSWIPGRNMMEFSNAVVGAVLRSHLIMTENSGPLRHAVSSSKK